jgi:chemotaxis protein MotB
MKNTLRISLMALVLVSTGCVSAGKYKDLEKENNQCKADLAACQTRVAELESKLGIASSEKTKLQGSVDEMQKALDELRQRKQEAEKRLAEFRELTAKFKELIDAGKLTVKVVRGRMMIALSTDVLFSSGSAALSTEGKLAIRDVAGLLKQLKGRNYQIEGHTDSIPIKSSQYPSNWELASARAMSVLNTMIASGVPDTQISAASYGSTQPVTENKTAEGRTANRRIAIVIVPDLSQLPGFDELNRLSQ